MAVATRRSTVMRTPTPTHLDPMPCEDSTLECFLCGMALATVLPVALWAMANPALAAAVVATAVVVVVTLVGLASSDGPPFAGGE